MHRLPAGVAVEASGVAVDPERPGVFYLVDDGYGSGEIVAVHADGRLIDRIDVSGMAAANAEAVTIGPCGSTRCLYVGDIGDGESRRESITVYRVSGVLDGSGPAAATPWTYTYPDGARDAESLIVDRTGVLIIDKAHPNADGRVAPHRIYRGEPGGGVLREVARFTPPAPRVPLQSLLTGTVVTDAAYDGARVLLLTYDQVLAYTAPDPDADPAGFPDWPVSRLPDPVMPQAEGIASLRDRCGFVVVSEAGPGGDRARIAVQPCSP